MKNIKRLGTTFLNTVHYFFWYTHHWLYKKKIQDCFPNNIRLNNYHKDGALLIAELYITNKYVAEYTFQKDLNVTTKIFYVKV